ncbi:hypothetical protein B8V81_0373 [Paenibacillus pasadenensis]|uniref:Uncharacterized protein n=1 Tax=Paenibacillus pasadenensis TaxID=217090 RepID=A0A2N5ND10_9BACL|nr:hypothetical protein B8V81_0373 [Paenibacillus pasadenensis]
MIQLEAKFPRGSRRGGFCMRSFPPRSGGSAAGRPLLQQRQ